MKLTIDYATSCYATIYEANGDSWQFGHRFTKLADAIDWARFHIEARPISFEISVIYICDANTGEILATCEPETEGPTATEDWEDNYNEDEGFDPYLGCYTDDC